MVVRILILYLTLCLQSWAQPATPLITSLSDLRALSEEEATKKISVELNAQVTRLGLTQNAVYIHDGTTGGYVELQTIETRELRLAPGQLIQVKGYTKPGLRTPQIEALAIKIVGDDPLPDPIGLTSENISMLPLENAWVTTQGKVLFESRNRDTVILTIESVGEELELHLPKTLESDVFSRSLIDTKIQIQGVLSSKRDDDGALTHYIGVPSPQFIRMISPRLQEETQLIPLSEVREIDTPRFAPLKVRGVITYHDQSRVIIQQNGVGLLLRTTTPCPYAVDDRVEAIGFASTEAFTTSLKAQSFSLLESSPQPTPRRIEDISQIDPAELDNTLVTVTANILKKETTLNGSVLTCSIGKNHFFRVGLPTSWNEIKKIPTRSTAEITGIYQLSSASSPLNPIEPDGFQLLVMDIDQIKILSWQGWWNINRVFTTLAAVGSILLIALTWVWLLKRKVAEQTDTIRSQVAQESSAQERERVARELHDSLEQNLSAVAFQIDNSIRFYDKEMNEKLGPALQITKKMLKACQRESREAIYDLRGSDEESAAWRDEMLLSEAERLGAEIRLRIVGDSYSLDSDDKRQLRRIIREATYNALRHGGSSEIRVEYIYEPENFTAIVRDNGTGFDVNSPRPDGHFGLAGMEERAGRIGAKFILESEPGSGTTVTITLPIHRKASSQ